LAVVLLAKATMTGILGLRAGYATDQTLRVDGGGSLA
jgi:hypothetical protein